MKIIFLTLGDEQIASSRTRVFQFFPYFDKQGVRYRTFVTKFAIRPRNIFELAWFYLYHFLLLLRIFVNPFYNVIFIQKVLLPKFYLTGLKILGKKIVFDFDDAIYTHDPSGGESREGVEKHRDNSKMAVFLDIVSMSDLVIMETHNGEQLARRFNLKTLRITGPIDTTRYVPKPKSDPENIIIGWIGSRTTTKYLKPLIPIFKKISAEYPQVSFKVIGAEDLSTADARIQQVPWSLTTEVAELQKFDIGIMPLTDDEWTKGKGGYKLLQYMAIGIPCIASPYGINSEIVRDGENGYLVENEWGWCEKLKSLIEDASLRERMGARGREIAEKKYSLNVAAPILLGELQKLAINQKMGIKPDEG